MRKLSLIAVAWSSAVLSMPLVNAAPAQPLPEAARPGAPLGDAAPAQPRPEDAKSTPESKAKDTTQDATKDPTKDATLPTYCVWLLEQAKTTGAVTGDVRSWPGQGKFRPANCATVALKADTSAQRAQLAESGRAGRGGDGGSFGPFQGGRGGEAGGSRRRGDDSYYRGSYRMAGFFAFCTDLMNQGRSYIRGYSARDCGDFFYDMDDDGYGWLGDGDGRGRGRDGRNGPSIDGGYGGRGGRAGEGPGGGRGGSGGAGVGGGFGGQGGAGGPSD